jgi:hypothetical protein
MKNLIAQQMYSKQNSLKQCFTLLVVTFERMTHIYLIMKDTYIAENFQSSHCET